MFKIFKSYIIHVIYKLIEIIEKKEYRNLTLDENDISKKILNSINIDNKKVKTDTDYSPIIQAHLTQPYKHYELELKNGYKLTGADNHIVFTEHYEEIFIKDILPGTLVQTDVGVVEVLSVKASTHTTSMFDISVDNPNQRYYSNGILSHNTICSAITILHFALFNNNKNILVTANKLDTVTEIIDKIKEIYQHLPFFLQQGIKTLNQKQITFENKSRIKGFATTKTASIGNTGDMLYLDEFAYVPNNIADKFYKSIFPTISNIDDSKIIITSTPNGFNLFHKLLIDAERDPGDPLKTNYKACRVYWNAVPKRNMTYIRLNPKVLHEYNFTEDEIFEYVSDKYSLGEPTMKYNSELNKYVIFVSNDIYSDMGQESIELIAEDDYKGISFKTLSEITSWKLETMKDIGGEEAFNQEYDLRFINTARSLLNEKTVEALINNKKTYSWEQIPEFDNKLRWSYKDLVFVDDPSIFLPINRKDYKIIMSVDIAEGLGLDYSVINIFKISPKSIETIEAQREKYTNIKDFFFLEQIGFFRSNLISVKQLAEILYLLAFEYFNDENVKIALEMNTYGNELLAHMPHLFQGVNNYGPYVFLKYKHRVDANEEKIGIKVGDNKNLLIKLFQDAVYDKNIQITNPTNVQEITTFVKTITTAGNVTYKSESVNDDTVMTSIHAATSLNKNFYKVSCEEMLEKCNPQWVKYVKEILNIVEYKEESMSYNSFSSIARQKMPYRYRN